jgi:hypothetical protein
MSQNVVKMQDFVSTVMDSWFNKIQEMYLLADRRSPSQAVLCFMKLDLFDGV